MPENVDAGQLLENPDSAVQREGAIKVDVAPPFEVYPSPTDQNWDSIPWVFHAKALPTEVLKERFPDHKDDIKPESGLEVIAWPFDATMGAPFGLRDTTMQQYTKEHARLKEYFEKPSAKWPRGRHAVQIGDKLIEYEERLPYDHLEFPLAKFDYIVFPGRMWGASVIDQLIPLQREYNRTRSQIIENKNMMSRPKLLVPSTAEIPMDAWTTEPGEKIIYNPLGGRPEPWVPPPIPGYVLQELERTESDMMEVSSQHYAARGLNPPGVRTAAGLAMLQEADDTPFGPVLQWNENAWRTTARQVVELGKQFFTEPRIVYMGFGASGEVAEFSREKLKGRYRIRVDIGSSLPMSRAARIQFALELLDRGAFRNDRNQIDEVKFFTFLEMEATIEAFQDEQIDIRVARGENVEMRDRGTLYEPGEYDNHPIHIIEHVRFMKQLNINEPQHRSISVVAQHIKMHELRMRQMELKKAEEQISIAASVEQIKQAAGLQPPPEQQGPPGRGRPPQGGPPPGQGPGGPPPGAGGPPPMGPGGPGGPGGPPPGMPPGGPPPG
jgi:hypothetical protein